MPFKQSVGNLAKALVAGRAIRHAQFFALATLAFNVQALSPSQVFDKVKDSVVVVKTFDTNGNAVGQGSGVFMPSGKIGTNCHVVKNGASFQVGGGKQFVPATLWGSDEDKDICLLEAIGLTGEPAQLGQASRLKVGEPVYAVGAPRGLELSLSDGIVSQLRGGPPPFIQTTAAISPGSSGGGLFDAEGRLVGFTTLYIEGGQSLNFAMPVEWAGEIQPGKKAAQGSSKKPVQRRSWADWEKRTIALEAAKDWTGMRDWSQRWIKAQPGNIFAWMHLSKALGQLKLYTEAIEAARQALKINPELARAWIGLGDAYSEAKRFTEAIEAYRQAIRVDPEDVGAWLLLGNAYSDIKRYSDAIEAYRQAVRIDPKDAIAWEILAISYAELGDRTAALEALSQVRRIDPAKADKLVNLVDRLALENKNAADGWVRLGSDKTDTQYANPSTIRRKGNMVKMWDLIDLKKAKVIDKSIKPFMSRMNQSEYDCDEERMRTLSLSLHSGNMAKGNVVFTDSDPSPWYSVPPESRGENLWLVACGKAK